MGEAKIEANVGGVPLFDRIVVVDWSANAAPKQGKDSIWISWFDKRVPQGRAVNIPTRAQALDVIEELAASRADRRTLVAVDFSLGFPSGTAAAFGVKGTPRREMWKLLAGMVTDGADNANNRFDVAAELNGRAPGEGPFWGRPHTQDIPGLMRKKVSCAPLPMWRHCEQFLHDAGRRPFSAWQLYGAGAVGSQTLLGVAALERLQQRLAAAAFGAVAIWPFTTGLVAPDTELSRLVVAEIWPSMVDVVDNGRVHDEAQVLTLGSHLDCADQEGTLASWFAPDVPKEHIEAIVEEEGWVLGAGSGLVR